MTETNTMTAMKGITGIITTVAVTVLVAACSSRTAYSEYHNVPLDGWDKDSALVFEVAVQDTLAAYNLVLSVRHGQEYPFQNIWFFVENGLTGQTDTLEYYLADQRGRWLGNGFGDKHEMPCLIGQNVRFSHARPYLFKVRQGMREDRLSGITEVGLTVEKQ